MGVAFIAYVAAARVVLSGGAVHGSAAVGQASAGLRWWLIPLAFVAFCLTIALSLTYLRGRLPAGSRSIARHAESAFVARERNAVHTYLASEARLPDGYELAHHDAEEILFIQSAWHGDSTLAVTVTAAGLDDPDEESEQDERDEQDDGSAHQGCCWVRVQGAYSSRSLGLLAGARGRKDRAGTRGFLEAIQAWGTEA